MKRMAAALTLILAISLLLPAADAGSRKRIWPGPYRAEVQKVIDADTIRVVADVWPGINVPVSVRLAGIDTPESRRSKCPEEKLAGKRATAVVRELVQPGSVVLLRDVHGGKYSGRVVARVLLSTEKGDVDIGQLLVTRGLARPYFGGTRENWCAILKKEAR